MLKRFGLPSESGGGRAALLFLGSDAPAVPLSAAFPRRCSSLTADAGGHLRKFRSRWCRSAGLLGDAAGRLLPPGNTSGSLFPAPLPLGPVCQAPLRHRTTAPHAGGHWRLCSSLRLVSVRSRTQSRLRSWRAGSTADEGGGSGDFEGSAVLTKYSSSHCQPSERVFCAQVLW